MGESVRKLSMEELGRASVAAFKGTPKIPLVILLDNVRSLHNVGSVFRTSDAFCVEKLVLAGITGTPPHREINKTALGATESVEWEYAENAAQATQLLKRSGYTILVIEQTNKSVALQHFAPLHNAKYCLVFGNEVDGVSDSVVSLADYSLEIPQQGTKHSLNIAVCAGIVAWEFFKKLGLSTAV
jgi:23S rRNA (guanosine2251-2'-O)-methyltransferase